MNTREKIRRLAHHFARHEIKMEHYDNCKISYSHPHVYSFVFEMLLKGYSQEQIHEVYQLELFKWHGLATDRNQVFKPSGLISDARKKLLKVTPGYDPKKYHSLKKAVDEEKIDPSIIFAQLAKDIEKSE